jgi:MFS family permease
MSDEALEQPDGIFTRQRRALSLGILVSVSVVAFESLAVATILPTAAIELNGVSLYGWAFSAFLLASLVGAAAAGELADRYGPAPPALIGFAAFGGGLLVAGLAPAWPVLLLGRLLQGFGGGTLLSLAYVAVARGYPTGAQARILALLSSAWLIPALVGPVVAGQIAGLLSWRGVFLGLVPIALGAAAIFAPAAARLPVSSASDGVSRVGASARLATGVAMLLWGASQPMVFWTLVIAALGALLALPALVELLPMGTFAIRPGLPAGTMLRFFLAFGFFGGEALIPLGLTMLRQVPPTGVGIALSVAAVAWIGASWLHERVDTRDRGAGRHLRVYFGLGLLGVGILATCGAILWSPWPAILTALAWGVSGFGIGVAYPASTVLALNAVDAQHSGDAAASLQIAETLGTAVGTGITTMLVASAMRLDLAVTNGVVLAFCVAAAVIVLGFVPALRTHVNQPVASFALMRSRVDQGDTN